MLVIQTDHLCKHAAHQGVGIHSGRLKKSAHRLVTLSNLTAEVCLSDVRLEADTHEQHATQRRWLLILCCLSEYAEALSNQPLDTGQVPKPLKVTAGFAGTGWGSEHEGLGFC